MQKKVKSRDCALASDLVRAHVSPNQVLNTHAARAAQAKGSGQSNAHVMVPFFFARAGKRGPSEGTITWAHDNAKCELTPGKGRLD